MKIPFISKLIEKSARGKLKIQRLEERKLLSTQRAKAKREEKIKTFVKNGERAALLVKNAGVKNLSLGKLKIIERALTLELINFDKSAVGFGGHWANVQDTAIVVRKRIADLTKAKKQF